MAKLLDLSAYFSVILRGLTLICESLLVGGTGFQLLLGMGGGAQDGPGELARPFSLTIRIAATGLAVTQLIFVSINCLVLTATTGLKLSEVIGANFAIAGLTTVAACMLLIVYPGKGQRAAAAQAGLVLVIMLSSVATSHAWSRMDHREISTGFTFLHHLAAGIWIGALPYLLITLHRAAGPERVTSIVRSFSAMAMASVSTILISGASLAFLYLKSPSDLYGTSYGAMVVSKILLTAGVLTLGAVNFFIVRRLGQNPEGGFRRLRRLLEAEIGIGFTVMLAAASLASQLPAIDLVEGRVTREDVIHRYTPHVPRLTTPPLTALSPATEQLLPNTPGDIAWSEYNHHWAGLIVAAMGLLAFASGEGKSSWARHWPLLFIGLAVFLFLRADPENWPLGPNGFWESFRVAEVLQHRFFMLLIVGFAIFEWRVQNGHSTSAWMPYIFPAMCALGGAALLSHSHSLNNDKESTLIELSHIPIAILAVYAGWSRWLELRMKPGSPKALSWIWRVCFFAIGVALLSYREG